MPASPTWTVTIDATPPERQEPRNGGSGVDERATPPLAGMQKAIDAVAFAVFVRGGVQEGMNMLKAKVEGSS
jgi:isopentenyl diphosphate isomerase/L-lactate dehydrogenase-like FMN-dependent dehydrogenase